MTHFAIIILLTTLVETIYGLNGNPIKGLQKLITSIFIASTFYSIYYLIFG
jgi:hypothetical protein